jgi:glutamyl-tRNA synthetase
MHIGHVKASLLNNFFARNYQGKLILRFDDTNPAKEKDEYADNIKEDLMTLEIKPDHVSYTSDFFDQLLEFGDKILKSGKAYIDNTPQQQMREERTACVESRCRNNSIEENLRLWGEMKKGTEEGMKCVMRAKIDMKSPNGALRDPGLYRCNTSGHYRTGTKYKAYPMYDFACPIVDSLEGVTHALRSSEYHDRNPLYYWVIDALGIRKPHIEDFSRLNFEYVLLSKRKLQWFVDNNYVNGWADPRFPTVQGILRRGMTVEALKEFILAQGASKALNLMNMDKLWAINKKIIDPIVPRYTALDATHKVPLTLTNGPLAPEVRTVPRHKKNPALGNKPIVHLSQIFLEADDAAKIKLEEEVTLMDWGNAIIHKINHDNGKIVSLEGVLHLEGDFKKTEKKLTWLPNTHELVPIVLQDYGYLITKPKLEEGDNFIDFVNQNSLKETTAVGDSSLRLLNKGEKLQLERRGYFIVDQTFAYPSRPMILIAIPDGKESPAENATNKPTNAKQPKKQQPNK